MDDYGNQYNLLNVWKQYVGYMCGEFGYYDEPSWPLWSEQ